MISSLFNKCKVKYLKSKGQRFLVRGKMWQAHAVFEKLLLLNPSVETHFNLGLTLLAMNRYEEAEHFFSTVAKDYPDNHLNLLSLGETKLFLDKWDEAIEIYKTLIRLYPENKSFQQQLEIAEDVVLREKYIKSKYLINEARDFLNKKQGEEAIERLEKALSYNPKNSHLLNNIGSVYLLKKKYKKAYEYFEKALSIDPDNRKIQHNINLVKKKM